MTRHSTVRIAVTLALLLPGSSPAQGRAIADQQWLVGCWERTRPYGRMVESWSAPVDGVMTGMSTSIRDSTRRVLERLRLFRAARR